jgi:predicted DNA-binding transcriptional regulator AlpA
MPASASLPHRGSRAGAVRELRALEQEEFMENKAFIRMGEVCSRVGLSATTISRLERRGEFPRRRQLSRNAVGWLTSEVDTWISERRANGLGGHK